MELLKTNGLIQALFLVLLTALACTKVTLQGRVSRRYIRVAQDSVLYNALFFSAVALALFIVFPQSSPTPEIVLLALLSGVCNAMFQILYSIALNEGPVSLTVLMTGFSVFFPTVLCIAVFHEKLFLTQFVGVLLLLASMILNAGHGPNDKKGSVKWIVLTLLAMLASGGTGCIQKLFYSTESSAMPNSTNTFLVTVYIFSALLSFATYFFGKYTGKKEKSSFWFNKNVLFYALGIGVVLAVFQKLYMLGIAAIDGSVFFPTYSGMTSLAMTAIGIVLFKDHLSRRQWLGVLCGIASVALINIKIGICLIG